MNRLVLLNQIYDETSSNYLNRKIEELLNQYSDQVGDRENEWSHRDVLLITYADSILQPGKRPLETLRTFMERWAGDFNRVHILPFYPYTSDDGFSVLDYKQVNESFGTWEDIKALSLQKHLMFDAVINHISAGSSWVYNHLNQTEGLTDYVLEEDPGKDWQHVVRPRTSPLMHAYKKSDGSQCMLWTTFSEDQVDLNYRNPDLLLAVLEVLFYYVAKGASTIRLDAIGFMWKEEGTSCIHLPQTHALIKLFRQSLASLDPGVKLVTETNVPHLENISYFGNGKDEAHMVYNFTLPPLLAYSLLSESALVFYDWAKTLKLPGREVCFFNFLASHDGVGVRPVQGILNDEQLHLLVEAALANGGQVSYKANSDGGKDPYELNCNYYSLLRGKHKKYQSGLKRMILAHALLLSFPGLPAIYIHSLLGSENDIQGLHREGYARAINREKIDLEKLEEEIRDKYSDRYPVYQELSHLIKVKQNIEAFHPLGRYQFDLVNQNVLKITRKHKTAQVICLYNFSSSPQKIDFEKSYYHLLADSIIHEGEYKLGAYDFLWLNHFD